MLHTAAYKGLICIPLPAATAPPGGLSVWMDLFFFSFCMIGFLAAETAARLSLPVSALRQLIEPQTSAPTPNLFTAFFPSPTKHWHRTDGKRTVVCSHRCANLTVRPGFNCFPAPLAVS